MILDPEDDPRLVNVQRQLVSLRQLIDTWNWEDEEGNPATRAEAKRLTKLFADGILYEPKF